MQLLLVLITLLFPVSGFAYEPLTYHYEEQQFTLDPDDFPFWRVSESNSQPSDETFSLPPRMRVCREDGQISLHGSAGMQTRELWNRVSVAATIGDHIGSSFEREAGTVRIYRNPKGEVEFEGTGLPGRRIDTEASVELTVAALQQGLKDIVLPVITIHPHIRVDDSEFWKQGIREVVAVGESDFSGSAPNRRHNILLGLERINGTLIGPGGIFSFTSVIGPVSEQTGFEKELVILGEKTLPEFGGGLCQLSTTVYRAAWIGGLPVSERRNHSFAVSFYSPPGTDATVYPPYTDFRFGNDTPGALLLQTFAHADHAYAILYGTDDGRETDVFGPYISNLKTAPPDRLEETSDLSPGERKKLSERRDGFSALWYRMVLKSGEEPSFEAVRSIYEPRPLWEQVGVRAEDEALRGPEREDREEEEVEEERST